ncbi:MAG TPA: ferredoxin-type protein NapG [Thiohalobacter sp.]|nr:ferredoxin-type protein NapG [Thiohalobacter sp.]
MTRPSGQSNAARRRFLVDMARTIGGVALLGLGVGLYSRQSASLPATAIRPPGALRESDFAGACIRCGLCVRDCPYATLKLAEFGEEVMTGTPYFQARAIPCEMCEDIPCVKACPTGALDPGLTNIDDARMGLAVLIDRETCLNLRGLRCDVCYRVCPLIDQAITLEMQHDPRSGHHARFIPTVHSDQCTGCGKCEHACVLDTAAIRVLPRHLAKGELGAHYRLGWEEKSKAGRSLVSPDSPRQFNLPEGVEYDYQGEGVIMNESAPDTPFGDSALQRLNRGSREWQGND